MAQFIENAPVASDFMETARSFGNYDLALSLADLVDNSISADANEIDIVVKFDQENSVIKILDNGKGMSSTELYEAMRMASQNPKNERTKNDMGRFGGPYTWDNYHGNTTSGKGRVYLLDMPFELWSGQTPTIKADAVHE